jgi:hypothetical protein
MKAGGLELGSALKDTMNATISISGEASTKRLSSQSMCESPWVGHEHENYIARVSSTPGSASTARKMAVIIERMRTVCRRVLMTGVLFWLSDIAVIIGCVHCVGCPHECPWRSHPCVCVV